MPKISAVYGIQFLGKNGLTGISGETKRDKTHRGMLTTRAMLDAHLGALTLESGVPIEWIALYTNFCEHPVCAGVLRSLVFMGLERTLLHLEEHILKNRAYNHVWFMIEL